MNGSHRATPPRRDGSALPARSASLRQGARGGVIAKPNPRVADGDDGGSHAAFIHLIERFLRRPILKAGLGDTFGGAFGEQFGHGKVVVGVDAKWTRRGGGTRLRRGAEFRQNGGGAERGHPVKKITPR